jgi:hypothetical protein
MSDAKTEYPRGKYVCPECKSVAQIFVAMTCAPECTRHTSGPKKMEAK